MYPIGYFTMIRNSKDPRYVRLEMVRLAREEGIKPAARRMNSTVKTVKKWLRRWVPGSLQGLEEQSRAPKNPAKRIPENQRKKAIKLKKKLPNWGASRIKDTYGLSISDKAIRKIWKKEDLLKKRRRKHKTKQDLRKVKAAWKLFEQTDLDTKDLIDIPELWPQIQYFGLPKVQYTAREVVSGLQFLAYAQERSLTYSNLFVNRILTHLQNCGVDLDGCRIQTDNGSEFIGSWQARQDSIFTKTVHSFSGLKHFTIPPSAHTWQADVETAHNLIELEFYEVEKFSSKTNFLQKADAYSLWFNVLRKNSYKGNKTPWQIIQERNPAIKPQTVFLPPVLLDDMFLNQLPIPPPGGYDVIPEPSF